MAALPKVRVTPEEYLSLDRRGMVKSEFIHGEIVAMTGASLPHNFIAGNIIGELRHQLKGKPYRVTPSDVRVFIPTTGNYVYPDVVVVCGEPKLADANLDILLNPTLIVEILSDSTEAYDRGQKFEDYRKIASFKEYLLVRQNKPLVERYVRQPNHDWVLTEYNRLEATIDLTSVPCQLPLAEVYDKINLKPTR